MIATTYDPMRNTTASEATGLRPHRGWRAWGWPTPRHHDRPAEILAVLEHARGIVEAGWVQNRWCVQQAPVPAPAAAGAGVVTDTGGSVQACLVGAVALAVRDRHPHANIAVETGPALAFVWDAVHEGWGGRRAAGRSAPHATRIARMRDLARWNDERGRTRADVIAALDRAAAGVVRATVEPARV
jgi:hypothetical protein